MLEINDKTHNKCRTQNYNVVEIKFSIHTCNGHFPELIKVIETHGRQEVGGATMGVRIFTGRDSRVFVDGQSLKVGRMKRSVVVSTGRRGSPGRNSFGFSVDSQCISSAQVINVVPASRVLPEGISNTNSLIKNFNLRPLQSHVKESPKENTPAKITKKGNKLQIWEILNNQNGYPDVRDDRSEDTTFWFKEVAISHVPILSHGIEEVHV